LKLTKDVLNELLIYNPETGKLYWKVRDAVWFKSDIRVASWNARYANKEAFTAIDKVRGYHVGAIFNRGYQAHRIIWMMVYGVWPDQIDHINHNKLDNRIENLRDVTQVENSRNQPLSKLNISGKTGVHWCRNKNKWVSQIMISGKNILLGRFNTFNEAAAKRDEANMVYGFHKNHGASQ